MKERYLLPVILLMFIDALAVEQKNYLYLFGYMETNSLTLTIMDVENEDIYYFPVTSIPECKQKSVLFDKKSMSFILICQSPLTELKIFILSFDADNKVLSPIYIDNHKGNYQFHSAIFHQEEKLLCIIGYRIINNYRKTVIKLISLADKGEQEIDITRDIINIRSMYLLKNDVIVAGLKNNLKSKSSVKLNLADYSITGANILPLEKYRIKGIFDDVNISLSDNENLFSYDLEELSNISVLPEGLSKIYGLSSDKNGYYGLVSERSFLIGERNYFVFVDFKNVSQRKIMFDGIQRPYTTSHLFLKKNEFKALTKLYRRP